MGHKISREQIDPGVKDHIMSFVGDVADLETEVNTDIISAVNSLMVDRVDNAENMGKLANAIGEPVTANHSVDEVVEGLGEMLSTFKTNMMNSGVVVESSDKFKSLIDKIKGLTEGEGNKGIQYAEGETTVDLQYIDSSTYVNQTQILDFTPSIVFVTYTGYNNGNDNFSYTVYGNGYTVTETVNNIYFYNSDNNYRYITVYRDTQGTQYEDYVNMYITTSKNKFDVYHCQHNVYGVELSYKWYAIGVGEEDTTLRDSLASILTDEGVSVTEEDDMASLISKVDTEFDDKRQELIDIMNNKGLNIDNDSTFDEIFDNINNMPAIGTLDVVVANELPTTVTDNKIVILSDVITDNFAFCAAPPVVGTDVNEGDIAIQYLGTKDALNIYYEVIKGISFYMTYCYQVINGSLVERDLYYGKNGEWVKLNHTVLIMNASKGIYADISDNLTIYGKLAEVPESTYDSDSYSSSSYTYTKLDDGEIITTMRNSDGNLEITVEPTGYSSSFEYIDFEGDGYYSSTNYVEGYSYVNLYTHKPIDITGINTLEIDIYAPMSRVISSANSERYNGKTTLMLGLVDASSSVFESKPTTDDFVAYISQTDTDTTVDEKLKIDVSGYSGDYKILIHYGTNYRSGANENPKTFIVRSIEVVR